VRFEVTQAGGAWDRREAVRDGRIITAQTWQSHPDFYRMVFAAAAE
jgi:protease I